MIGSHDTFTYRKPLNPIFNLFKRWWKCQNKIIEEQYNFGIRFFDIRVVHHNDDWYLAHGLVTFKDMLFPDLTHICGYMKDRCPDAIYRIVLERGSKEDELEFMEQTLVEPSIGVITHPISDYFPNLWRVDIKSSKQWKGNICNNNQNLYDRGYKFALGTTWESPSHELHGYITKDNWYKINLKKEAKKINSSLDFFKDKDKLKQMIESKDELYFLDYCTNEY